VCDESLNSLKPGGRLMITGVTSWYQIPFNLSSLQGRPMTLLGSGACSRRSFAVMMHMMHRAGLRGVVDRTFDMAHAGKAHEVTAGRDFFGKLVLRVP
jgi:NADPH:quinone reductase-like Zn-dependent oxidoreductase